MNSNATSGRIVCGLDDSRHAADVLSTAAALAGRLDLRLTVVHSPGPDVYVTGAARDELVERGEALVSGLAVGHQIDEVIVRPGDPARLLAACLDDGATLAVVGSRGRPPVRAALLGSVSAAVVRQAPCPVVVVPPDAPVSALGDRPAIVCGLDGSLGSLHALDCAAWLAEQLQARVLATRVHSRPLEGREQKHEAVREVERELARSNLDLDASVQVEVGDPAAQLDELAAAHRAGLIVVGTCGDSGLRAALVGSVSGRLAARSRTPVVVVPRTAALDVLTESRSVHAAV